MWPARTEKFQKFYVSKNHGTYLIRFIRDKTRGMDLYIGRLSLNSTALEVACPPPGIGAKNSRNFRNSIGVTYRSSSVAFEGAVVDLHIDIISINSSALEVA